MKEVDVIGNVSLNLFLSLALMNLNIAKLLSLAGPMIAILFIQTVVMMIWAYFVTFRSMQYIHKPKTLLDLLFSFNYHLCLLFIQCRLKPVCAN